MVRPGRAEMAAAMGSPPVVMALILGQDRPQMPFPEEEHPVGDLGTGGEHEPFCVSVRAWAAGGIFTTWIPASAKTASNDAVRFSQQG